MANDGNKSRSSAKWSALSYPFSGLGTLEGAQCSNVRAEGAVSYDLTTQDQRGSQSLGLGRAKQLFSLLSGA